jgi:hypothetical protein
LLAEEFDPLAGHMLGNFPQAYSHVGLINSALNLTRREGQRVERERNPPGTAATAVATQLSGQKGPY